MKAEGWEQRTITLSMTEVNDMQVEAWCKGGLAYHRSVDEASRGWTITQMVSGIAVLTRDCSEDEIRAAVDDLLTTASWHISAGDVKAQIVCDETIRQRLRQLGCSA